MNKIRRVVLVFFLTTPIFIVEGTLFSRSKCQISSQVYVDKFKVLAEDAESLIHCSALALFSECERTLFNAKKKICACIIVVDSDVSESHGMTKLDDLLASLGNDTFFYEVPTPVKTCLNSNYVWVSELGGCIKVVEGTKTFDDADNACKTDGSRLISTATQKQSRGLIRSLVCNGYTSSFWIGLVIRSTQLAYTWLDKSPVSYKKWGSGQPSNSVGLDNCAYLHFHKQKMDYEWYNEVCTDLYGFVCGITVPAKTVSRVPQVPQKKGKR